MKTIEVNKICEISQNNTTPFKYNMEVAILVQAIDDSFQFILGIDDSQQFSEDFGTHLYLPNGVNSLDDLKNVEVKKIEHFKSNEDEYTAYIHTSKGILLAEVYNHHSGYYNHDVYIGKNSEYEIDYL